MNNHQHLLHNVNLLSNLSVKITLNERASLACVKEFPLTSCPILAYNILYKIGHNHHRSLCLPITLNSYDLQNKHD